MSEIIGQTIELFVNFRDESKITSPPGHEITKSYYVIANVLEELAAYIFRVGVLKMEAAGSTEMLLSTYQTTRSHNPEDRSVNHTTANMIMITLGGRDTHGTSAGATNLPD
jgi:hypothetical protein